MLDMNVNTWSAQSIVIINVKVKENSSTILINYINNKKKREKTFLFNDIFRLPFLNLKMIKLLYFFTLMIESNINDVHPRVKKC
jgi:hypothetical protein